MEKEKPIYDGKDIKWYDMDEVNTWNDFEKQKIFEMKTRPTLYDLFKESIKKGNEYPQHIASTFLEEKSDWGWKYAFITDVKIQKEQYEEILKAINYILNNYDVESNKKLQ